MCQQQKLITTAVIVKKKKHKPVNGEQFLMQWLHDQEEAEKEAIINKLWRGKQ